MYIQNTLQPYYKIPHIGVTYGHCREYSHICRYKSLRQIQHGQGSGMFVTLETPNPFIDTISGYYYEVKTTEENRLDLIAFNLLGSADYAWIIAYLNGISDGFSVVTGQKLLIPKNISVLFNSGGLLATVNALNLNLGAE